MLVLFVYDYCAVRNSVDIVFSFKMLLMILFRPEILHMLYIVQRGNGGDFDLLVAGLWYGPVLTAHSPGWGVGTNDWWA